jgi:uncharacterized protein with LGFP repeats
MTMKKIILLTTILFSAVIQAQNGKSRGKVEDIRRIIIEKANQLNLKPSYPQYVLNTQPLSNEVGGNFAYFINFSDNTAAVYCKSNSDKAFALWGAIYYKYTDFVAGKNGNFQYFLGAPTSDEFKTPKKNGAGQHFEGGSIYWSPATGAHEVHGAIKDKWASLGWENSFLGFPKTDETATPDGYGRFNFFEGGAIYYHPNLGTFAIPNMIVEKWKKEGWEKGKLGYPTSDEIIKGNHSVQLFEFGAVISSHASPYQVIYNSFRADGGLYEKWKQIGGMNANIGLLVVPNKNYPKMFRYHFAEFEKGYIYENPKLVVKGKITAFVIKKGPIFDYYAKKGWENSHLGFPISDEATASDGSLYQNFENGTIYYTKALGAFETKR